MSGVLARIAAMERARWWKTTASVVVAVAAVAAVAVWWGNVGRPRAAVLSPGIGGVVAVAAGASAAGTIAAVWSGFGLRACAMVLLVGSAATTLCFQENTRGTGAAVAAAGVMVAALWATMGAARAVLGGAAPVRAIASNTLREAGRTRIALAFVAFMIMVLAAVPGMQEQSQPLQYRVQSFLQYGVAAAFWSLACMTLFFCVAAVTGDQREKTIWQTMAKPVAPWQYVLGRWLGVAAINAALLTVAGLGVYLLTTYLRNLPANDEAAPYVAENGGGWTNDRTKLEREVLVARNAARVAWEELAEEDLQANAQERLRRAILKDPTVRDDPANAARVLEGYRQEIYKQWDLQRRSVIKNGYRRVRFTGLGDVPDGPLLLRYTVLAGANNPGELYELTFVINNVALPPVTAPLKVSQSIELPRFGEVRGGAVVPIDAARYAQHSENGGKVFSAIDQDGTVQMDIYNGNIVTGAQNPHAITFPGDGLELLYGEGAMAGNFVRVMLAMWMKLVFIAAVAIAASTFLSFPVAVLLAAGVLFAAETSGFLAEALQQYTSMDAATKQIDWFRLGVRAIAMPISWAFSSYGDLAPATELVRGRSVGWAALGKETATLGAWTAAAIAGGWGLLRRRELATYSGK